MVKANSEEEATTKIDSRSPKKRVRVKQGGGAGMSPTLDSERSHWCET
jgi:hypothetical protein